MATGGSPPCFHGGISLPSFRHSPLAPSVFSSIHSLQSSPSCIPSFQSRVKHGNVLHYFFLPSVHPVLIFPTELVLTALLFLPEHVLIVLILIFLSELVLTALSFFPELVLIVLIFLAELAFTVLIFPTELVLTVLIFLAELAFTVSVLIFSTERTCCTDISC